jgi:MYXO-CTERM domain-containing protein
MRHEQAGRTMLLSSGELGAPEPGTWTLALIGFGALGVMARRRALAKV